MKSTLVFLVSATSFFLFTAGSCEKKQEEAKCPQDVICTMMFASINTSIVDGTGSPLALEEVYTLRKSNNEILRYENNPAQGQYTVLNDSYQKDLANQTDTFQLIGKKEGKTIVQETFVIAADCCHVKKISGPSEIPVR